ncbi:MAG: hypothetical protein A2Z03_02255 [Chloroflexi bacterium RBG_16_56_8]|nr:MAG: hypothetical protein A2Z03_02255 [Chloroflexi bacterium RBG_16_56_8]
MTILALFASTFALVFALGIQQLNVQNDHRAAAVCTSLFIGASQLVMFKLAPDASPAEAAAFLLGGPLGIYAAMVAHPWLVRVIKMGK